MRLHGIERRLIDQRRNLDSDDLARGLERLVLGAFVELVPADVGRAGQDAVDLADAPAPAIAGEDAALVQVGGDVLFAHRTARAVALQGELIDEPNRVRVQRINLQLLLDLRAALLGRNDAIANRRQRSVPEPLPRILLQSAQNMLCVLLGLILDEQRRIMTCIGSSPISCVMDTSLTPFFASLRT